MRAVAARDPNSALVLVSPPGALARDDDATAAAAAGTAQQEREGGEAAARELARLGVAVLRGSVERVDPQGGILLTRDERLILFDSLTVEWSVRDRGVDEAVLLPSDETAAAAAERRAQHRSVAVEGSVRHVSMTPTSSAAAASAAAMACSRGCSRIVKRKSLHAGGGEGLHHVTTAWRMSQTDTWPW